MSHSPLLLQIVVILGTARLLAWLLRFLGQPAVIGEMMAGIVLGPIVLGQIAPEFHATLFAKETLSALDALSQLGLVLFMFIVGAELRFPAGAHRQFTAAVWIGTFSVLIPMIGGLGVGVYTHDAFANANVSLWPYALFMAAAMSITAFPVLARILRDRRMTDSPLGALSLASAAVADVLAWIVVALVVALIGAQQQWSTFVLFMGGTVAVIAVALTLVRPLLANVLKRFASDGRPEGALLAGLLIGAFGCAYLTNVLGIHAVFGAFLFGVCLPRDDRLVASLVERIEHIAILVLMPIFFALAGLSTTADVFGGASLGALLMILGGAVAFKVAGAVLGARIAGQSWHASLAVGTLMNTRGMMELVVIKVGLDIGVIDSRMFTILMVMAIVTTCMTGPLLNLFERPAAARTAATQRD